MEIVAEVLASLTLILEWYEANASAVEVTAYSIATFVLFILGTCWRIGGHKKDKADLVEVIEDAKGNVSASVARKITSHMRDKENVPSVIQIIDMTKKSVKEEVAAKGNSRLDKYVKKMYEKEGK